MSTIVNDPANINARDLHRLASYSEEVYSRVQGGNVSLADDPFYYFNGTRSDICRQACTLPLCGAGSAIEQRDTRMDASDDARRCGELRQDLR